MTEDLQRVRVNVLVGSVSLMGEKTGLGGWLRMVQCPVWPFMGLKKAEWSRQDASPQDRRFPGTRHHDARGRSVEGGQAVSQEDLSQ